MKEKEKEDGSTEETGSENDYDTDTQKFEGILEETPFDESMRIIEQRGSIRRIRIY